MNVINQIFMPFISIFALSMIISVVFKPSWMKSQNPFTGPFFSWTVAAAYSITFGVIGTVLFYFGSHLQFTSSTKKKKEQEQPPEDIEKIAHNTNVSVEKSLNNLHINSYSL